jgi:hypothetical protein
MARRFVVSLNEQEREHLLRLIHVGKGAARKLAHARILLKVDQANEGPCVTDGQIAAAVEVSEDTVARVRRRFVEEGFEAALERKAAARPPRERVIDGAAEAKLVALCCGSPPEGRARWTLQLLADKLVQLEIVESVSHETVRQTLKKRTSALAQATVVHSARAKCRFRLPHGGRSRNVSPTLRPGSPRRLHGRSQQAVGQ